MLACSASTPPFGRIDVVIGAAFARRVAKREARVTKPVTIERTFQLLIENPPQVSGGDAPSDS
jgi:hypothetical protein